MSAAAAGIRLRRALDGGGAAIGTWLSLASTGSAEILSRAGFDWLLIDQQHTAIGPAETLDLVRAVGLGAASPVVRIPVNAPGAFDQALDSGAHAVMVPGIETPEEAEQAVALSRYPPAGRRSIGGYRAQYSFGIDRGEYVRTGPAMLVLQIEHIRAVERIEQIVRTAGVDGYFVGPQDLSASMGLEASLAQSDPSFEDALRRARDACTAAGIPIGILVSDPAAARARLAEGFRMVAITTDAAILAERGRTIASEARARA